MAQHPPVGQDHLIVESSWSHSHTHQHTRQDSSGRVSIPTQKPLPDNTQHSQQTDIHAPGGIRNHHPSKRAAEDPRLCPLVNNIYIYTGVLISPYSDQEGNKQMFPSAWREFPSAPCLAGKTTWWQLVSRCCWNRAHPWHASEIVSFLVGLRTYQHPGIYMHI